MKRDFSHHPIDDRLTEEQKILLVYIAEEAAEVVQSATKILRFGKIGKGPPHDLGLNNHTRLLEEWNDLEASMNRYWIARDR